MKRRYPSIVIALGGLVLALSACTLTMDSPTATPEPVNGPTPEIAAVDFDPSQCASDDPGPNVVSISPVLGGDDACYRLPLGTEIAVLEPANLPFMPIMVEFYFLGAGLEPDVIGVDYDATDGIGITWQTPPFPFRGQVYAIVYSDDKTPFDINTLGVYGE